MNRHLAKAILVLIFLSAAVAISPKSVYAGCWDECVLGKCIKVCNSENPVEDIQREGGNVVDTVIEEGGRVLREGLDAFVNQDDNCTEKKATKGRGWNIVFGPQFNEGHYADFVAAIATAVEEQDTAPLEEFFGNAIDRIYNNMGDDLEEIGEQALFDLLMGAIFSNGKPIQQGRFEIEAGLMECQRWAEVSVAGFRSGRVDLIPVNYPYVRYRTNSALRFPIENLHEAYETVNKELNEIEQQLGLLQQQRVSSAEIQEYLENAVEDAVANAIVALAAKYMPHVDVDDSRPLIKGIVNAELNARNIRAQSEQYLDGVRSVLSDLLFAASTQAGDYIIDTIRERPAAFIFDWAKSDERASRQAVEEPGWHVVWGQKINDVEYGKLLVALVAAPETGGASLMIYFDSYLERTLAKLETQAPSLTEEVIKELMSDLADGVTSGGRSFAEQDFGDLKVQVGLLTYNRSIAFDYPEVGFYPCEWSLTFGDLGTFKTDGACTKKFGEADADIPLPNHHQPYIRFRWKDGKSAKPTGPGQATNQPVTYPNPVAGTGAGTRGTTSSSSVQATVITERLNVRMGPGTGYPVVGVLRTGQSVDITGQNSGWWQIRFRHSGGEFGWISGRTDYVTTQNSAVVPTVAPPTQGGASSSTTSISSPQPGVQSGLVNIVFGHSGKCVRVIDGDLRNVPTQIEQASCRPEYRFTVEPVPGMSGYYYIKITMDRGRVACLGVPDVVKQRFGNGAIKVEDCRPAPRYMWRIVPQTGANAGYNLLKIKSDEGFCLGVEDYENYTKQKNVRLEDKRLITVNWCGDPWQLVQLRP